MSARPPVPAAVLAAFGLPAHGTPLAGGQGTSVRHGDAVLKPAGAWSAADLLAGVVPHGFRLPAVLRAGDGRTVVDGWAAARFVSGRTGPAGHWPELFRAARALHAALAALPRPDALDHRTDRWAHADRVAWGERTHVPRPELAVWFDRLQHLLRPVHGPAQLIHGDLAGNVLFAPGELPAVLDFSPYWRPAPLADAMIAVDGLLWYGADADVVSLARVPAHLLARAALFRLVAHDRRAEEEGTDPTAEAEAYERVTALIEHLAGSAP